MEHRGSMGEHQGSRGSIKGAPGRSTGEPELVALYPTIAAHVIYNNIRERCCLGSASWCLDSVPPSPVACV